MIGRREVIGAGLAAGALPLAGRALAQADGPITSKIALVGTRVLMAAKVGATGPYFFALDTGGDLSLIDTAFAKKLGMKEVRGLTMAGVGGRLDDPWFNAGDLTLANGMRLPQMLFAGMRGGLGHEVVGSFGAGLFTSFDSDLDFAKGEWRAWLKGRPDREGWTMLESRFTGRFNMPSRIMIDASLDSFSGEFLADTGAPTMVSLSGPAAKSSGLWNDSRPFAPAVATGIGRGGMARRIVRVDKLKIGKFTFERPLVSLATPGAGEVYDHDGLIGLPVLARLNLSTDVKSRTLWAQPSGVEPVHTPGYSRAGLWLSERDGRVVVADVGTGGPAKDAGVQIGDVVPGMTLPMAIRSIGGPNGREVTLKLERGGATREVKFKLAEYL